MLFAYLLLNRDRPLGRRELIDALWSRELPQDPPEALAALLSKLRVALQGRYLEGRGELSLVLPADADVDVERAFSAAHRAESACALADWPRAWSAALCAQMVAKRTLLGDYEAEWVEEWRRRLDDLLVRSLESYARASLGLGGTELASAERAARQLVRSAPLRESGYGLLMAVLEAEGNVAEALRVYEGLRRLLRDELGVFPTESMQATYVRLLGAPTDA
jgi:SARP family transcriptional regulator, regulator of embCAB operon